MVVAFFVVCLLVCLFGFTSIDDDEDTHRFTERCLTDHFPTKINRIRDTIAKCDCKRGNKTIQKKRNDVTVEIKDAVRTLFFYRSILLPLNGFYSNIDSFQFHNIQRELNVLRTRWQRWPSHCQPYERVLNIDINTSGHVHAKHNRRTDTSKK